MADRDELSPEAQQEIGRVSAHLDAEVRLERAEYEAMALRSGWRKRRTADVLREWMIHGDRVEIRVADVTLTGTIHHVGADVAVLDSARGLVDVALGAHPVVRLVQRGATDGVRPGRGAKTLSARLTEHEVAAAPLELVLTTGQRLVGVVEAVAVDHVLLASRRGTVMAPMPLVALAWPERR